MSPPLPSKRPHFTHPRITTFPPFYTLQPNPLTRLEQLRKWSRLIQRYTRHHSLYKLSLPSALDSPLFVNQSLKKRLGAQDAKEVVEWMCSPEGGRRAEWIGGGEGRDRDGGGEAGGQVWVFWKRPEEWGDLVLGWVEETGQKGTVLTLYEILEGEGTIGEEFHGMDSELFRRALSTLVKRGKAQVFGSEDQQGVKFF
ncbi:hypothetical protein ACLMJK_004102 [Lecanora helva]